MSTYIKPKIIRGLLEATQADSALIIKIRKKTFKFGMIRVSSIIIWQILISKGDNVFIFKKLIKNDIRLQ
jgi:hypothetical protein